MKSILTYLAAFACALTLPAFSQEPTTPAPLPPIAERTEKQIADGQPYPRTQLNMAAYWRQPEMVVRVRDLAAAAMDRAIAGGVYPGITNDERRIIENYWRWIGSPTDARALALLKLRTPLPMHDRWKILPFVNTREKYDIAKANNFVVEGNPLLPDMRSSVLMLACKFKDYAFVDSFERAGALSGPLTPTAYMEYLQWKLIQIPDDKGRYEFLQNELTNLMLSKVGDVNNNKFADMINKASDLIYLRLRRTQTLSQPVP